MSMEIGILTFGEVTRDPDTGRTPSPRQRLLDTLEQARLADEVGLDVFGVGEHHRGDFIASSTPVILSAIASVTKRIRLASTVTVLSSDDPVRVWEQYATIDQISGGRAEIMAGRGSYTESFPLFGYSLQDYDALFAEKLDLLLRIRDHNPVTWSGRFHAPLTDVDITPRSLQNRLPIWQAVGGTAASAVEAGRRGIPLMIAFLAGPINAHTGLVDFYHAAASRTDTSPEGLRIGASVHGFVASDMRHARDAMYPRFVAGMSQNGHRRGEPFPLPRKAFDLQTGPAGMIVAGGPQEVIDKIMTYRRLYGIDRIMLQMGFGGMPQKDH
uniref:LLM class flavin-dependent oxidoreductase n=1 Tax=uncultured Bifidobacterium sp. TaxID=165187 RepID=UPI0028DC26A2